MASSGGAAGDVLGDASVTGGGGSGGVVSGAGGAAATGGGNLGTGASGAIGVGGAVDEGGVIGSDGAAGSVVVADAADVDAEPLVDGGSPVEASMGCPPCGKGTYCNVSSGSCTPCIDLSRLQFGAPKKVIAPSMGPGKNQNFPRDAARPTFTGLVYSVDAQGQTGIDVAFAPGQTGAWPTGTVIPAPIASTGIDEAPFPMNAQIDFQFLYDTEINGRRFIYTAGMPSGWTRNVFGAPTAAINSVGNNYHVTAQFVGTPPTAIGRLWWITDRPNPQGSNAVRMVTANRTDIVSIDVPIVQANGCHTGGDLEPWVVQDGSVLFFSSLIFSGTSCGSTGDGKRRLSYAQVNPATGLQVGRAAAIALHVTGFDDHAPSLTADMCSLLFASDRDGGSDLDVFIAPRE